MYEEYFIKENEKSTVLYSAYYISISQFKCIQYCESCKGIISNLLKTKYFVWMEEFRDEVRVSDNNGERYADLNFYGFYNIKKISVENFSETDQPGFIKVFNSYMRQEDDLNIDITPYINELVDLNDPGNTYFILNNLPKSYYHEWSIYTSFKSGIICNLATKEVDIIEFGVD